MRKGLLATEYQECLSYYEWTQYQPELKELVVHHVNEGKRSLILGKLLKRIGLSKGLPDYQIFRANNHWHGLLIEMKTTDERHKKQPNHQVEFINKLIRQNYYATFAFGVDDAIRITKDYLSNRI
jgi:hypothetical protein